jgi:hypothetical protein
MRFAHLKTHHRFERMRLRGLSGARDEFHLVAVVQNLKTLVRSTPGDRPLTQADAKHRVRVSPPTALSNTASASTRQTKHTATFKNTQQPNPKTDDFINTIGPSRTFLPGLL